MSTSEVQAIDGPTSEENSSTLFVGDLSYFCDEADLTKVFGNYGTVVAAQLKKGRSGDSLMHGFVEMSNHDQAEASRAALSDTKFMGRRMRVNWAYTAIVPRKRDGWVQVHVSFVTRDLNLAINEEVLDSIFSAFGEVADITIKRYVRDMDSQVQSGYGFVFFLSSEAASSAVKKIRKILIQGVTYDSSLSYRSEKELMAKGETSPKPTEHKFHSSSNQSSPRADASQTNRPPHHVPVYQYDQDPMRSAGNFVPATIPISPSGTPMNTSPVPTGFGNPSGNSSLPAGYYTVGRQSPVFLSVSIPPQQYNNVPHPNSPSTAFQVANSQRSGPYTTAPGYTFPPMQPMTTTDMPLMHLPPQQYPNYAPYPMMAHQQSLPMPMNSPPGSYVPQYYVTTPAYATDPNAGYSTSYANPMNAPPPSPSVTIPHHMPPSPILVQQQPLHLHIPSSGSDSPSMMRSVHSSSGSPIPSPMNQNGPTPSNSGSSGSSHGTPKYGRSKNAFFNSDLQVPPNNRMNPSPRSSMTSTPTSVYSRPPFPTRRSNSGEKQSPRTSSSDQMLTPHVHAVLSHSHSQDDAVERLTVGIGALGHPVASPKQQDPASTSFQPNVAR